MLFFRGDLELVVDPSLCDIDEFFFNAAGRDGSIALRTADYFEIAKPRIEQLTVDLPEPEPTF